MSLCACADKKHTHAKINTGIRILILLPFKFLSAKLQKIMIQAKEYPPKNNEMANSYTIL